MTPSEILSSARALASAHALTPWRSLMLVLLPQLTRLDVPHEVLPALEIAQGHWSTDDGDISRLAEAKAMCWDYLGRFPSGHDLSARDGRYVRALLCVLEPVGDQETASITAEWFAEMIGNSP